MNWYLRSSPGLVLLLYAVAISPGCSGTGNPGNVDCLPDNKSLANCVSSLPKSNYPLAPEKLMRAQLTRIDGKEINLAELKGKVVIVNLWATWCGPCVKEMPDFEKLYKAYNDKGLEIVGIDADEDETSELIKSFAEKIGVTYTLAKAERETAEEFIKISKVDAIPQTFLIDREGRLVGVFVGGGSNVEKIKAAVIKIIGS